MFRKNYLMCSARKKKQTKSAQTGTRFWGVDEKFLITTRTVTLAALVIVKRIYNQNIDTFLCYDRVDTKRNYFCITKHHE